MSRGIIGGIVAVAIAALTAIAYFVTTSQLESEIVKDVKRRVLNAQDLLRQNAKLEMLRLQKSVEALAREERLLEALQMQSSTDKEQVANAAFRRFLADLGEDDPRPDFFALTNADGDLVALLDVSRPAPDSWKNDNGEIVYPAVKAALDDRQIIATTWNYRQLKTLMKVGVAPVIDDVDEVAGALVVAYSLTSREAEAQEGLLGMDVAYFYGDQVFATSLSVDGKEDTRKKTALEKRMNDTGLAAGALERGITDEVVDVTLGGEDYLASAASLPRFESKPLPADFPKVQAGAVVLMSLSNALEPIGAVKTTILMLGIGALIIALLAVGLTARGILQPLEQIEIGVSDIINGNIDRTFQPVSPDVDGLANGLNVMLARLLGRPEPGEEEYDEEGNVIGASGMAFDTEGLSEKDAEAVSLAQEPEPDYYKRIFGEFVEARRAAGDDVSGINYEGFVAKLRLTEANLKKKYNSRAVRFKVVTQNGKVTLKPVPIS